MNEKVVKEKTIPLFVYGTLKKGFRLHHLLKKSAFVNDAKIKGLRMFSVGGYPCVIQDPEAGSVSGEVYDVPLSLFGYLDAVEGSYNRKQLYTTTGDLVNVYVWKYTTDNMEEIPDGIWKEK